MDIYKLKFTILQQEVLRFLFIKSGMSFTERALAKHLNVSPTAVSNAIKVLEKKELLRVRKDKVSGRLSIGLNKDNPNIYFMKRVENLRLIYESGLAAYLSERFPGSTIILFGSYSFGEDIIDSDIDIAIIGSGEKDLDVEKFSKLLERGISLNFYDNLNEVNKNLKENILNGIAISGGVKL